MIYKFTKNKQGARVLSPRHKQNKPSWRDCGAWSLLEVQAGVGEALGLLALWPPTVTNAVRVPPGVRCVSGVPSLATVFTSSRTFSRIAPSISGPQYSPQPREFGDHEKAEGPPRGERRKLPITLSRQAKTQKSWLSIPGRPPLRSTLALVPWCDYG